MLFQFLRANQNFVGHLVQHIEQLLLLLVNIDIGQEHFCLHLMLDVEYNLKDKVAKQPRDYA